MESNTRTNDDQNEPEVLGSETADPSATVKDPSDWVTGDQPATGAQKSYLDTLAREAGETIPAEGLTKAEASEHIDRLQDEDGTAGDA
ncbi:DUF3072 domain-containing protein [Nocardioides sp. ChNu-153]|uniref:DUF3072 domain-containing protein n=1 Tax=unclassified Nocardioides TaxID=2615069 RepID=UPI0024056B68|nr:MULTISPECIES: DUF3072 domain-containing protein [unclassified Nocardioides]MDF9715844.1 DUF3072 domain-containing protein [Nocardioides sp. ChNu-99]MDN7120776.1 DUF3072 domain-containing protein [Nocardioides sp. ChNu-153]